MTAATTAARAIAIGTSTGGFDALRMVLGGLPAALPAPVLVVAHRAADHQDLLSGLLRTRCALEVVEAEDKMTALPARVHIAPSGYHLLVERDRTLALSVDAAVAFARPSIDVLFETAAEAYGRLLVAVVLTGANADGAAGLAAVRRRGGIGIVQDPDTAAAPEMPRAAIAAGAASMVLPLDAIAPVLRSLAEARP